MVFYAVIFKDNIAEDNYKGFLNTLKAGIPDSGNECGFEFSVERAGRSSGKDSAEAIDTLIDACKEIIRA
jgi:hypothetical protein